MQVLRDDIKKLTQEKAQLTMKNEFLKQEVKKLKK